MSVQAIDISGYRSVRHVYLPLQQVNVIVGSNGTGKTNLYRALHLLHHAAAGRLARGLADEGGMPSALWAGKRKTGPVRLGVAVRLDDYSYHLELGLPPPNSLSMFGLDPQVKEEHIYLHRDAKKIQVLRRANHTVWARDADGKRVEYPLALGDSESVLAEIREPHRFPELSIVRQELLGWRFYHHFRTDAASPLRQPQVGVRTPVLSHDGADLAAAIQTLREVGDGAFAEELASAFPGSSIEITGGGRMSLAMYQPGFQRPFGAAELSDGTLQYLCLLAALLSPRPPGMIALNEPETSIHPDLLPALARLIVRASQQTQLWVTTHSLALADAIAADSGTPAIQLEKVEGETRIVGQSNLERLQSL